MATFRSSSIGLVVLVSLACVPRGSASTEPAAGGEQAKIEREEIAHVFPRPDAVGPMPARLEWTAAREAETYSISVETEIEIAVFEQDGVKGTSVPWPKEITLDPGTYYWRVVGMKGTRSVADSGRAAFVVLEQPNPSGSRALILPDKRDGLRHRQCQSDGQEIILPV